MAKISAKGAVILVDNSSGTPQDISSDCKSYEIEYNADPQEVTGFNDGSKNYVPGMLATGITLDVFWNTAATTGSFTVLKSIIANATSKTLKITPEVGGPYFQGEFMLDKITPKADRNGVIELGSCHFSVMGNVAPAWT